MTRRDVVSSRISDLVSRLIRETPALELSEPVQFRSELPITQNQTKHMIRYHKAYIKQQRSAGLKAFKTLKYVILIDYPMDRNCSGELRAAGRI